MSFMTPSMIKKAIASPLRIHPPQIALTGAREAERGGRRGRMMAVAPPSLETNSRLADVLHRPVVTRNFLSK
jgi:hypothetical protein